MNYNYDVYDKVINQLLKMKETEEKNEKAMLNKFKFYEESMNGGENGNDGNDTSDKSKSEEETSETNESDDKKEEDESEKEEDESEKEEDESEENEQPTTEFEEQIGVEPNNESSKNLMSGDFSKWKSLFGGYSATNILDKIDKDA